MNNLQHQEISTWYNSYVDKYRTPDGSLHLVMNLKLKHSRRVAADCLAIATELGWNTQEQATAETVGLLHDISRFSQYAQYKTFLDRDSFNHGERGYEILLESGALSALPEPEQAAILNSVRYHNRRELRNDLSPNSLRYLKLSRDADKLDILEIIHDTIVNNRHREYPEILCYVDPDGPATPALVAEIKQHGFGSYENVHSLTDMNLMRLIWVYDLNYLPSLRRLHDRNLLDRLEETMVRTPEVDELLAKARKHVEQKLRT